MFGVITKIFSSAAGENTAKALGTALTVIGLGVATVWAIIESSTPLGVVALLLEQVNIAAAALVVTNYAAWVADLPNTADVVLTMVALGLLLRGILWTRERDDERGILLFWFAAAGVVELGDGMWLNTLLVLVFLIAVHLTPAMSGSWQGSWLTLAAVFETLLAPTVHVGAMLLSMTGMDKAQDDPGAPHQGLVRSLRDFLNEQQSPVLSD